MRDDDVYDGLHGKDNPPLRDNPQQVAHAHVVQLIGKAERAIDEFYFPLRHAGKISPRDEREHRRGLWLRIDKSWRAKWSDLPLKRELNIALDDLLPLPIQLPEESS